MFKILQEGGSIQELAKAYAKASIMAEELETEMSQSYENLMRAQQDSLENDADGKGLKKLRENHEQISIKFEAVKSGMSQIRSRIQEQLPVEYQKRCEAIHEAHAELQKRKDELWREYLDKYAEAIVIEEQIKGIALWTPNRDGVAVEGPFRGTRLDLLSDADYEYLREQVKKRRTKFTPIDLDMSKLSGELYRIETLLEDEPDKIETQIDEIISSAIHTLHRNPAG